MVQIIFAIQWLVTGTIGAFPKCLLMLIKKNLASEVLWKKKSIIWTNLYFARGDFILFTIRATALNALQRRACRIDSGNTANIELTWLVLFESSQMFP